MTQAGFDLLRIDGQGNASTLVGTFQAGVTLHPLAPGLYEAQWLDLMDWHEPEPLRIRVVGARVVERSVIHAPLVTYPIGSIRNQNVWHATRHEFRVGADSITTPTAG